MSSFEHGRALKGWHQSPTAFSAMGGICSSFAVIPKITTKTNEF